MTTRWKNGLMLGFLFGAMAVTSAQEPPKTAPKSLSDRLGGLMSISVVVNDLVDTLHYDPVLNANPEIDAAHKRVPAAYLKYQLTSLVCQATGGSCQYGGRSMTAAHAHLNIGDKEWDRLVTVLKDTLAKHKVPAQEQKEILDLVEAQRAEIVIGGKKGS